MDIAEPFALAIFYIRPFGICFIAILFLSICMKCLKRNVPSLKRHHTALVLLIPVAMLSIYVVSTFKYAFLVTALDTEDEALAQSIYTKHFNLGLDDSIQMALDKSLGGNVRFYASCHIADLLKYESNDKKDYASMRVGQASFTTSFFGTNSITVGLFIPNRSQGPFFARDIILKRLQQMDTRH